MFRRVREALTTPHHLYLYVFLYLFAVYIPSYINAASSSSSKSVGSACSYCRYMVESFRTGLVKTENQHFAGGNTDWEERKLGTFRTSETRFVEIMDTHMCKKPDTVDNSQFDSLKDLQFKCNTLAEDSEDLLEKWFFHKQDSDPDIFQYVCIDELKRCCPEGHYGVNCAPCPGALKGPACFGNGKCNGDGTREGSGKCECNEGYAGVRCSSCDAHFFPAIKNDSFIVCKACFDGCASGCTSEFPTGCYSCRSGYRKDDELGCVDIDECAADPNPCNKANELCKNTQGHYSCECKDGYRRNFDTDECELDVHAAPYEGFWRPDRMLRAIAVAGLTSTAGFIVAFHRSRAALAALAVASALVVWIERNVDENSFSRSLREMLRF